MKPGFRLVIGLTLAFVLCNRAAWGSEVTVYAAASLTNALQEVTTAYEANTGNHVKAVFAGSSTLAKQIEAGAPAQVFVSADQKWMDYLQERRKIEAATRRNILGNTLVLIAPKDRDFAATMEKGFDLPGAFEGRLCTGDTDSVPVGVYAKEGLQSLGWWERLKPRIVGTDDVRTALAFVERGECPAGIVYATDAAISNKVDTLASFPESSHKPIVYPAALVSGAGGSSASFLNYLSSETADGIFKKAGFTVIAP